MLHRPDNPTSSAESVLLHAQVTSLAPKSLTLSQAFPEYGIYEPGKQLDFDYAVYALGSHLPAPINLWGPVGDDPDVLAVTKGIMQDVAGKRQFPTGVAENSLYQGTKPEGIDWLQKFRERIDKASSILVVGGGPLGVREYLFCKHTAASVTCPAPIRVFDGHQGDASGETRDPFALALTAPADVCEGHAR